eukprot:g9126.t1
MVHAEEVEGLQNKLAAVGKRRYQFYDADKHRRIKFDKFNPKKVRKPGKSLGYTYDGTYDFRTHAKSTLSQIRAEFYSIKKLKGMRISKKCDVALATSYPAMSANAVPTFPYYNASIHKERGGVWGVKEVFPGPGEAAVDPVVGSLVHKRTVGQESFAFPPRSVDLERVSMWLEDFDARPRPQKSESEASVPHGRMRETPNGVPSSRARRKADGNGKYREEKCEPIGYVEPSEECVNKGGQGVGKKTIKGVGHEVLGKEEKHADQEEEIEEGDAAEGKTQDERSEDGEEEQFYREQRLGEEAGEEEDAEKAEGGAGCSSNAYGGDINPIFQRSHRPWTEIATENMNKHPQLMEEIRRGRISYGRQAWIGCNVDFYDMDRVSMLVCGKKLSDVKDKSRASEIRFLISQVLEHQLAREIREKRAVVCATDGCVKPFVEVGDDGSTRREVRGGSGVALFFGDPDRPVAVKKLPVLGVCGTDPDSFDVETIAATLVPSVIGETISRDEDRCLVSTIYVVGDSNSLISALDNFSDASSAILVPLVREHERIPDMFERDIKIVYIWTPGHCASLYNDVADYVAEKATHWGPIGTLPAARFDSLGAFRPPSGLFRSQEQERLHFLLWVGFCHTGTLGAGPIIYEGKSSAATYTCNLCGKKSTSGTDHFLFSCDAEIPSLAEEGEDVGMWLPPGIAFRCARDTWAAPMEVDLTPEQLVCDEVVEPLRAPMAGVGMSSIKTLSQIRSACGLPHQEAPNAKEAAHHLRQDPRNVLDFVRLAAGELPGILNKRMKEVAQFENLPREGKGMAAVAERKQQLASKVTQELLDTTLKIVRDC